MQLRVADFRVLIFMTPRSMGRIPKHLLGGRGAFFFLTFLENLIGNELIFCVTDFNLVAEQIMKFKVTSLFRKQWAGQQVVVV